MNGFKYLKFIVQISFFLQVIDVVEVLAMTGGFSNWLRCPSAIRKLLDFSLADYVVIFIHAYSGDFFWGFTAVHEPDYAADYDQNCNKENAIDEATVTIFLALMACSVIDFGAFGLILSVD